MTRPTTAALLVVLTLQMCRPDALSAQICPVGTTVPAGVVSGIWSASGSPYIVTGNISITVLTIQPGVTVQMTGNWSINVLAGLTAIGTELSPIVFTTCNPPAIRWQGLYFVNTSIPSTLESCRLEYANNGAVQITDSVVAIDHCTFYNNSILGALSITTSVPSNVVISNCVFDTNSRSGNGSALRFIGTSSLTLNSCDFVSNSNSGGSVVEIIGGTGGPIAFTCCRFLSTVGSSSPIVVCTNKTATIDSCLFQGNTGNSLQVTAGLNAVTVVNTMFVSNTGLAIRIDSGTLFLTNSIIACNVGTAQNIWQFGGNVNILNSSIVNNSGVGLILTPLSSIRDSIIYFNNQTGLNTYGAQITGPISATYSDIQQSSGAVAGVGNINFNPVFPGGGCSYTQLSIVPGSPCIDAGDPAPAFDDTCHPPSSSLLPLGPGGTSRNDMGHNGGPLACNWQTMMTGPQPPTYPGSGVDFSLFTGVSAGVTAMPDIKSAVAGDVLHIVLDSPTGSYDLFPPVLVAQVCFTGIVPAGPTAFPVIHIDGSIPITAGCLPPVVLFDGLSNLVPGFGPGLLPATGLPLSFGVPSLPGVSVFLQGFSLALIAPNGIFAASDAHEIRLM